MVASSSDWRRVAVLAALALASVGSSCSVGVGTGFVRGEVVDPACELNDPEFELGASFFVADPTEDLLEIRVQAGANTEDASDGLSIYVRHASMVREHLGEPLPLGTDPSSEVRMTLYLNDTCPTWPTAALPALYVAMDGEIVFESIYAPAVDTAERLVHGRFTNVRLVDPSQPDVRYAVLSGEFSFLFNRGRPAQRFP